LSSNRFQCSNFTVGGGGGAGGSAVTGAALAAELEAAMPGAELCWPAAGDAATGGGDDSGGDEDGAAVPQPASTIATIPTTLRNTFTPQKS
jgi:hypothetical protein